MNKDKRHPKVKEAFELEGSNQAIKDFYGNWATKYDEDTSNLQYTACQSTYRLLTTLPESEFLTITIGDPDLHIMDVGCGTGLMGKTLHQNGYRHIDGCDLSLAMTQQANKLNIYKTLTADTDINQPINPQWKDAYDCSVSVGVFTPGHVDPGALNQLIDMTKSGGLVIVSTRLAYYDSTDYQQVSDQLQVEKKIHLLKMDKNQPYTDDSPAHYWAYAVL